VRTAKPDSAEKSPPGLVIWDTQYCPPSEAYTFFRDAMRANGLPFTPKQIDGSPFRGRTESLALDRAHLGRQKSVPTEYLRTKSDIAHSSNEWFCAFYILSGSMVFEQHGRTNLARKGDLLFFDSALPVKLTSLASGGHSLTDTMGFRFPKDQFGEIAVPEDFFVNRHYPRERLLSPLASTLSYISNRLVSASSEELKGLYAAIVDLIPLGVGAYSNERDNPLQSTEAASLRAIVSVIEDNMSKSTLSAAHAAKQLQLSESYVHRMFASVGTTFSAYVTAKRLDHVRADLLAPIGRRTAISVIAYKWGFNDLSTFDRAFKRRFGCTPRALRE
jgi:AraC family transcriptional regulator, positive regulator of tynA and feaB